MNSTADEKAEVDALIAQLSPSYDTTQKNSTNISGSPDANSTLSERKRIYIRQNSGSSSNVQYSGSPTDAQKHLLQKNTRIYKKNDRKSRQGLLLNRKKKVVLSRVFFLIGKGRGLAKKGGGGGNYTWGSLGSEVLDEYIEDFDEDDLDDLQYNQAKEKYIAESTASTLEKKVDGLKLIDNFDKDIKPIIDEYFVNADANDVAQSLRKFDLRQRGDGELLAYIVTIALEKSNVHKELISRLLHDLNGVIFRANDYINCFNTLLTTLNDLSLDNPECSTDIGKVSFSS
jgi:programmed cell death protein 4